MTTSTKLHLVAWMVTVIALIFGFVLLSEAVETTHLLAESNALVKSCNTALSDAKWRDQWLAKETQRLRDLERECSNDLYFARAVIAECRTEKRVLVDAFRAK